MLLMSSTLSLGRQNSTTGRDSTATATTQYTLDAKKAPPEEFIDDVLRSGNFIPDESCPWDADKFHANWQGYEAGHVDQESRNHWFESQNAKLAKFGTWDMVDIHRCDADYAMTYGDHALGRPFPFNELKPMLNREKQKMMDMYKSACDEQRKKELEEWSVLTTQPKYRTRTTCPNSGEVIIPMQPGATNLMDLYRGCVAALPELWELTTSIAEAGNSKRFGWSLKKLMRTTKKLHEKYGKVVARVTDISRSSIVLETLADLMKAYDYALDNADVVRTKNRFNDPELGYSDILLNVKAKNGFIVEVQLHLAAIYNCKAGGGHATFKWFRRLLLEEDMYEGDTDAQGARHGVGKLTSADGDTYEGQWRSNFKDGHGVYVEADGHRYEGEFRAGERHGQCTFTYFDGSKYVGSYSRDKKEGYGVFTWVDGKKYEGQWLKGKRHGNGTFTYADGSAYCGPFMMHKRHGEGLFTSIDGTQRTTMWTDDVQQQVSQVKPSFMWPFCCGIQGGSAQPVEVETYVPEMDNVMPAAPAL